MNRTYKKLFCDENKLREMLTLYQEGVGLSELARKYRCNHSSVWHQIKKHGVYIKRPRNTITRIKGNYVVDILMKKFKKKRPEMFTADEKMGVPVMNVGKSYADYVLEEELRRKQL